MNITLCGMMGCGKTTVGMELARVLKKDWCDTDAMIEEKHGKISEIFRCQGEAVFRDIETETAALLSMQSDKVISVGGGFVLRAVNVELLKKNGKIIYLRAKKETLETRLREDKNRPLLHTGGEDLSQRIDRLLQERGLAYEQAADLIVDVDEKTPQEIATEIIDRMGVECKMKGAGTR